MDPVLSHLLWAIGLMLVIGLPRIRSNIKLPREISLVPVPEDKLTAEQASFFREFDEKLAPLGFVPGLTYTAPQLSGANLSRAYFSSVEPTYINVVALTTPKGMRATSYVEMVTRHQDGGSLNTKNSQISSVFAAMPGRISQNFPGVTDIVELKRRHDARRGKLAYRGEAFVTPDKYTTNFQDYHRRWCEYQVKQGLLRPDQGAGVYRATTRLGLNGIFKYINPLADNFTLPRFATGTLLGVALPLVAILDPGVVASRLPWQAATPMQTQAMLVLSCYVLAGIAVGYVFSAKSFIWAFILGYLPWLFFPQRTSIFYVLLMTVVAHQVGRWRMRQHRLV